jgi:hypothetical protein
MFHALEKLERSVRGTQIGYSYSIDAYSAQIVDRAPDHLDLVFDADARSYSHRQSSLDQIGASPVPPRDP